MGAVGIVRRAGAHGRFDEQIRLRQGAERQHQRTSSLPVMATFRCRRAWFDSLNVNADFFGWKKDVNIVSRDGISVPMTASKRIFILNIEVVGDNIDPLNSHICERAPLPALDLFQRKAEVDVHSGNFTPLSRRAPNAWMTAA